jgi:ATP-dependent Clp protease protease subunit
MNYIRPDVATVCVGQAASMSAVLLAAGAKGKRVGLPSAKIMIHQPRSNYTRQTLTVTDQEIEVNLIKSMQKDLYTILARTTGQSYKKIKDTCELDSWFSSEESKVFGLVDSIVFKKK